MKLGENVPFLTGSDLKLINLWIEGIETQPFKENQEWKWRDYSQEIGLPYNIIGYGMSRVVLDLNNDSALKVAINAEGIHCNNTEEAIYKFAYSSVKEYLAEVKEHGHGWIIMEKMDKVLDTVENREKVLHMLKEFKTYGIHAGDIVDEEYNPKWKNIGINKEGKIKVIDYGHFKILRKKGR